MWGLLDFLGVFFGLGFFMPTMDFAYLAEICVANILWFDRLERMLSWLNHRRLNYCSLENNLNKQVMC